jgi:DNA polymerase-3 subunit epsilon
VADIDIGPGNPAPATYLELLAEVLEDGVLTQDEAGALASLAQAYSLSKSQVTAAHRSFLLALAHKAVEDGKITHDERAELLATADALGFQDQIVRDVLNEATAALTAQRGKESRPVPASWPHHPTLCVGDGVAFTGCDDLMRAGLEGRARAVGLRVTGSVSGRTAALITDNPLTDTTKARAARVRGTRVVSPQVFAELVDFIQPAIEPPAPQHKGPINADVADPSASAIRTWARQQGISVSTRGRIPQELLSAYQAVEHPTGHDFNQASGD